MCAGSGRYFGCLFLLATVCRVQEPAKPVPAVAPPSSAATTAKPTVTPIEALRLSIRDAISKSPDLVVQPTFRVSRSEIRYAFGGVNYPFLKGGFGPLSPQLQLNNDMTRVELMRDAIKPNPTASAYWEPVLDRAEAAPGEELDALERQDLGAARRQALVDEKRKQVESIFTTAIEELALLRSRQAVPLTDEEAWPTPTSALETRPEDVQRTAPPRAPEVSTVTQYRTEYRTEVVPVTHEVVVEVPVQKNYVRIRTEIWPDGQIVEVPEVYTKTEMVLQSQMVTENITRQVPVTVPVQVSATSMRKVEEGHTKPRQ